MKGFPRWIRKTPQDEQRDLKKWDGLLSELVKAQTGGGGAMRPQPADGRSALAGR